MRAEHFKVLADYNAWANDQTFGAVSNLAPDEYSRPRPSFFGGIHQTLNHILVVDRKWMERIEKQGEIELELDSILFPDLASLREARRAEDRRIRDHVGKIVDEDLERPVRGVHPSGMLFEGPLWAALAQLFNHQTHHRGQVHQMVIEAGAEATPLDLSLYLVVSGIVKARPADPPSLA